MSPGAFEPFLRKPFPLYVVALREPSARLLSAFLQLTAGVKHVKSPKQRLEPLGLHSAVFFLVFGGSFSGVSFLDGLLGIFVGFFLVGYILVVSGVFFVFVVCGIFLFKLLLANF